VNTTRANNVATNTVDAVFIAFGGATAAGDLPNQLEYGGGILCLLHYLIIV